MSQFFQDYFRIPNTVTGFSRLFRFFPSLSQFLTPFRFFHHCTSFSTLFQVSNTVTVFLHCLRFFNTVSEFPTQFQCLKHYLRLKYPESAEPAEFPWQTAIASASAASSGFGGFERPRIVVTIAITCLFSALP